MARQKAKDIKYDWRDVAAAMVPLREMCMKHNLTLDTRLLYRYKQDSPTVLADIQLNSILLDNGRQIAAYTSSLRVTPWGLALKPTADLLVASITYLGVALENGSLPLDE